MKLNKRKWKGRKWNEMKGNEMKWKETLRLEITIINQMWSLGLHFVILKSADKIVRSNYIKYANVYVYYPFTPWTITILNWMRH